MSGIKLSSVLALLAIYLVQLNASVVIKGVKPTTDSYLAALIASKATDPTFNKNRREDNTYPVYNVPGSTSAGSSESGYEYKPPSTSYGSPSPNYGSPTIDIYTPPASSYGGPYHKPASAYGPPTYAAPAYIPAPPSNYVPYGPPVEESSKGGSLEKWLLEKIKFKKKLGMNDKDQHGSDDSEDDSEERLLKNTNASHVSGRKLDDITLMLTRAIETFAVQGVACSDDDPSSECKFSNIYNRLFSIDQSMSVSTSASDGPSTGESNEATLVKNAANEVNEI